MTTEQQRNDAEQSAQHVGPVIFSNETARAQLVEEGEVVTFRTRERTTGDTWWRESRTGPKRGDCHIECIGYVTIENRQSLGPYADLSGFGGVWRWVDAIKQLHGTVPNDGWLYRVTEGHDGN